MSSGRKFHIGYDIGGTKTEIVLLSHDQKILYQKREPTERDRGYEHILSVLKNLFESCLVDQKISAGDISSIGLALPGSVDPKSQMMLKGNTQVLEGKNIREDLSRTLGVSCPIWAENDANCFALAECHFGAGKDLSKNMIGVILGTGLGGGIIVNGKILSGRRGAAGEIGHVFFKDGNKTCYCGQKNCAEMFLSGTGFQEFYLKETGEKASTSVIFQNKNFLIQYKEDLALFLARLTNILDPDYFVLGGGVSKFDGLYSDLENMMKPHLFYKENPPKILKHQISDSSGGIGAALLGLFDL